ncbi:MAG: hypothetical protein ABF587_03900, partial [Leuconostoc sp.]|uniref:hypothetical protein n=1 Tax=Leuconostoc sp. TaxID=1930076 RepID=UPI0039EA8056
MCVHLQSRFLPAKTLQFDFNHNMDHIDKQAYPRKSIAEYLVNKSNTTIVRYLAVENNQKADPCRLFS